MESLKKYCVDNPNVGPSVFFARGNWYGAITERVSSICSGHTYENVMDQLNEWCKAQNFLNGNSR